MSITLIVVMVSWVFAYVQTHHQMYTFLFIYFCNIFIGV